MRVETALHSSFELNVVHELDREALDGGETRVVGRLVEVVCVRVEPNEYHSPQRSANDTQARESINCPLKAAGLAVSAGQESERHDASGMLMTASQLKNLT